MNEIAITPNGAIYVAAPISGGGELSSAFEKSRAVGLLDLAMRLPFQHKSPAVAFWPDLMIGIYVEVFVKWI